MTNTLCLGGKYSTMRLLTQEKIEIVNNSEEKFETLLFLPEGENKKGEGGLRTQGYFKKSFEDNPLISIITVVFNGEKYLEETILSVLNQTYDNVEYIIIDGGSTDGTLDIIKKYEDKIDYWVSERDEGIYDAMNKGIDVSFGEIIGIINSDDYLYESTLENINNIFQRNVNLDYVYAKLDIMSAGGSIVKNTKPLGTQHWKFKLFKHMPFFHPSLFVKKHVYQRVGLFDISYKVSADYDFSLRLIEFGLNGHFLDITTGVFRLGGQSGGIKTYKENYKIAIDHHANKYIIVLNLVILMLKMYLRKIKKVE